MTLSELLERAGLRATTDPEGIAASAEVTGAIVGDVLSDILHRSKRGWIWLTIRSNANAIAVATHKQLAAVIMAAAEIPENTLALARREGVVIVQTTESVFAVAGRLWVLLNPKARPSHTAICDLHIHTCLSPCAEDEMLPEAIVETALERGLDVIGVCDHNSAENASQVVMAAAGTPLLVVPGIEVTTAEEIHVVCLFPTAEQALGMQREVYATLAPAADPRKLGGQRVVDVHGRTLRPAEYMLEGKSGLIAAEVIEKTHALGGLAVAAHVDRPIFSAATKFGRIPAEMNFDALEVSPNAYLNKAREFFPGFPVITSSDAHTLGDIGRVRSSIEIQGLDFRGVKEALLGRRFGPTAEDDETAATQGA